MMYLYRKQPYSNIVQPPLHPVIYYSTSLKDYDSPLSSRKSSYKSTNFPSQRNKEKLLYTDFDQILQEQTVP